MSVAQSYCIMLDIFFLRFRLPSYSTPLICGMKLGD
jgi:hypothetical protein